MRRYSFIEWLSGVLVTLGGINWGLIGFFKFDLLDKLVASGTGPYRFVTAIIGLAAVYLIAAVVYRYSTAPADGRLHAHV